MVKVSLPVLDFQIRVAVCGNRTNESDRLARPCPPAKPYIYSTYKFTSVLLLYCAHVHRFWPKKTEPANRQIWFAIQFTTNPLDGGDFKRLCHGRTKRFVPALATLGSCVLLNLGVPRWCCCRWCWSNLTFGRTTSGTVPACLSAWPVSTGRLGRRADGSSF